MNNWSRIIPGAVVGVFGLFVLMQMGTRETPPGEIPLEEAATIPVVSGGRIKPLDTVARANLMIISKRQEFKDEQGHTQPAIRWLLDVMISGKPDGPAWAHKVFRIENDQVLNLLDLKHRPGSWRYSLREIAPKYKTLEEEVRRIKQTDEKERTTFDKKVVELRRNLELFLALAQWKEPLIVPVDKGDEDWLSYIDAREEAARRAMMLLHRNKDVQQLRGDELKQRLHAEAFQVLATDYPTAAAWSHMLAAYADKDAKAFSEAVADYRKAQGTLPSDADKTGFEVFFNQFAPFYWCAVLYVFVFVLACSGWIGYADVLNRSAFWLAILAVGLHTWALGARMYIQGRPPVTNLYSSAVFIGWGCVLLGLFLERTFRNGIGNVVAGVIGGATVLIAHHLAESKGDTLEMMQAVLDTNFWLATHVTCVTMGYSATFFAGFLGLVFILTGLCTPWLSRDLFRNLGQMIYGVVCFATLFSFVGTVLGGIWADQSWGRFWGWDPKENGALLIVLMNALILHARWAGLVKQRGMAVLALVGNMVTGWSWFGTNQLSVGLHAYGFDKSLADGLRYFWISQLCFIGLGLIPTRYWRSFGRVKVDPIQRPTVKGRSRQEGAPVAASR